MIEFIQFIIYWVPCLFLLYLFIKWAETKQDLDKTEEKYRDLQTKYDDLLDLYHEEHK